MLDTDPYQSDFPFVFQEGEDELLAEGADRFFPVRVVDECSASRVGLEVFVAEFERDVLEGEAVGVHVVPDVVDEFVERLEYEVFVVGVVFEGVFPADAFLDPGLGELVRRASAGLLVEAGAEAAVSCGQLVLADTSEVSDGAYAVGVEARCCLGSDAS